jgi:hypothetical protein
MTAAAEVAARYDEARWTSMSERRPTTPGPLSAIRALRLDAWRPVHTEPVHGLLGSLRPILGDFAPARSIAVVPAQRTAPEVAEWLGGIG